MSLVTRSSTIFHATVLISLVLLLATATAVAQTFPGGWVEKQATAARSRYSDAQIQSFVPPTRGPFEFPAPYNTKAIRITDASDCGGADCVAHVSYSYYRNTNAHESSNHMWIFLGLKTSKGGAGPTLFKLDKRTDEITKIGPLFSDTSKFDDNSGEGWYFSASRPNKLYVNDGPKMLRYDVVSHIFDTVFDVTSEFGSSRNIWQMHSSNDDLIHSFTLTDGFGASAPKLGCVVFNETTGQFSFFAKRGTFDECHIDKSGRYLLILQNIDNQHGVENVFIDLQTGSQSTVYDQNGGVGHFDMGFGYVAGADSWNSLPNAWLTYSFSPPVRKGPVVFYNSDWSIAQINHLSHQNAKASVPMNRQFACGSTANRTSIQNEVLCFRLDTSHDQLVVAPIMTDLDASGGGSEYAKAPKGNLDISGKYYIWTTNLGGNRLDAIMVKVPSHLLVALPPTPINLKLN
jgi:hypothetical protein